jgi:hypothetical protein
LLIERWVPDPLGVGGCRRFLHDTVLAVYYERKSLTSFFQMALNALKSNIDNFPQEKVTRYIDRAVEQITKMESLLKSLKSFSMFEKPFIREISLSAFGTTLPPVGRNGSAVGSPSRNRVVAGARPKDQSPGPCAPAGRWFQPGFSSQGCGCRVEP